MDYLERLCGRYPQLEGVKNDIKRSYEIMKESYENGKVLHVEMVEALQILNIL